MAIIHNGCEGVVQFETRHEALARLAASGESAPSPPKEFRKMFCPKCNKTWDSKRDVWAEARHEENP